VRKNVFYVLVKFNLDWFANAMHILWKTEINNTCQCKSTLTII